MLLRRIGQAAPLCRGGISGAPHSWPRQAPVRSLSATPGSSGMSRRALLSDVTGHCQHVNRILRRFGRR